MNAIDGYLNEVCWAMGGSFSEQQAVRDELRAHIREQVRDLQLEGLDEQQALAAALRDLGDAETLGRSLRSSRGTRPLRRPLVQPAGALILERRSTYRLPSARLAIALVALAGISAAIALAYVWPG